MSTPTGPAPAEEGNAEAPGPNGRLGAAAVSSQLLEKLKLLPLRERELSTLRQTHQHQLRWIDGTQELMVRLTTAASLAEALDGIIHSLVDEFGLDIAGAATDVERWAGDAALTLTARDRTFIAKTIACAREAGELVVCDGDPADESALAWLIAGVVATSDNGDGPVLIVGRSRRTAPYYPKPAGEEVALYRHLISTLAQVFRAIELQANHNSELERKVAERTAALHLAQQRVVELEREKMAEQMAGGFAHEMRNALSGAKILIERGMGAGNPSGRSLVDDSADALKQMFLTARERLDENEISDFRERIQVIARNERLIDDTLTSVHLSIQRALAITTLIMEYSRIGFSRRGDDSVDLVEIARTIIAESQPSFAQRAVSCSLRSDGPCPLRANEAHLYSILKNLIVNAFDALCEVEDGRSRSLVVEVESTPERVVCRVIDNGVGVPAGLEKRIFEPFFSTKPQTGTGLGLGMVLKLVTLHEGTITLTSQADRGTTFAVEIPHDLAAGARAAARSGHSISEAEPGGAFVAR